MYSQVLERLSTQVFGLMCHQDPSLLLHIEGQAFPLCPRCVGLQIGFFVTCAALWLIIRREPIRLSSTAKLILVFALGALAVDWGLGQLGILDPTLVTRLVTGLLGGSALAILGRIYAAGRTRSLSSKSEYVDSKHVAVIMLASLAAGTASVVQGDRIVMLVVVVGSVLANAAILVWLILRIVHQHIAHIIVNINHSHGGSV